MGSTSNTSHTKKFAQTCSSRECRKNHKDQLTKISDAVTTPHEINFNTSKIKCLYCGRVTKLGNK
jgi:hypothetical protein